jgi:hypothetical protein
MHTSRFFEVIFPVLTMGRHLRPGGYIEMHEIMMPPISFKGSTVKESKNLQYSAYLGQAASKIGRDINAPATWEAKLIAAGFNNLHFHYADLPIGPWAKGEKNKIIGKLLLKNVYEGTNTTGPMVSKALGWEMAKVQEFINECQAEFLDPTFPHANYTRVCFAYAQKPV